MIEQTLQAIIEEYAGALWVGFITLVVTGFVLSTIRTLVEDLMYYVRARLSDIGYGQRIYYPNIRFGSVYIVKSVEFRYLIVYDDTSLIRIPLKTYMNGPMQFPLPKAELEPKSSND